MLRVQSRGVMGALTGPRPERTQSVSRFGRIALTISYPEPRMPRLPTSRVIFANPTVIAVLGRLVEGKRSVEDLVKECSTSEGEILKAVETLIDANLADRTEDDLIEPKNDAVFYFLKFVGMTRVHLDPKVH